MFTQTQAWVALGVAGLLDVAWAVAMKEAEGYTKFWWSAASVALLAGFVLLLGKALQVLPLGIAYSIWTGVGAAGTVLMGLALFGESLSLARLAGIGLVLAGIAVLKFDHA